MALSFLCFYLISFCVLYIIYIYDLYYFNFQILNDYYFNFFSFISILLFLTTLFLYLYFCLFHSFLSRLTIRDDATFQSSPNSVSANNSCFLQLHVIAQLKQRQADVENNYYQQKPNQVNKQKLPPCYCSSLQFQQGGTNSNSEVVCLILF